MPPRLKALRAGMEKYFGVQAVFNGADLSKAAGCEQLVADAEKRLGGVDVLVNNAGIQFVSPIENFPPERWDAIIAVNLSSAFHTIRVALPGMRRRGWGRLINTASTHGLVASINKVAYVAAKHAIVGLTKVVASRPPSRALPATPSARAGSRRRWSQSRSRRALRTKGSQSPRPNTICWRRSSRRSASLPWSRSALWRCSCAVRARRT